MKKLTCQDWVVLGLTFILILTASSLFFIIDETSVESMLPWYLAIVTMLGLGLSMLIHAPVTFFLNVVNGNPMAPHGFYFTALPVITAFIYTALLGILMSKMRGKKEKK